MLRECTGIADPYTCSSLTILTFPFSSSRNTFGLCSHSLFCAYPTFLNRNNPIKMSFSGSSYDKNVSQLNETPSSSLPSVCRVISPNQLHFCGLDLLVDVLNPHFAHSNVSTHQSLRFIRFARIPNPPFAAAQAVEDFPFQRPTSLTASEYLAALFLRFAST